MGTHTTEQTKERLLNFLKTNFNFMAYSPAKMKGVSREIIEHKLNMKNEAKPVRQRKRNLASETQVIKKK